MVTMRESLNKMKPSGQSAPKLLAALPLLVVLLLLVLPQAAFCNPVHYVNINCPGPVHDGLSWNTAFLTVQEGLNAASGADEVWVAYGVYIDFITLKSGVGLYGGFIGSETTRAERNWTANVTVLEKPKTSSGSVVTSPAGATATTTIDGFTIRRGSGTLNFGNRHGGGMYCSLSSPTVNNCTFTNNSVSGDGGAIYCYSCTATVTNNIFSNNRANASGGAIACANLANAAIIGNLLFDNSAHQGGAVSSIGSNPLISGNTLVGNKADYGGGILFGGSPCGQAFGNVVAFNSSGLNGACAYPQVDYNCVYNPGGANYTGVTPGTFDISQDPLFLAPWVREYHLRPTSPCVNAGDDTVLQAGWLDLDGKTRKFGAHVDIGCFEWDTSPYWVRRVAQAKAIPDSFDIQLRGKPVIGDFDGMFYVEDPDRGGGMQILTEWNPTPGDLVTVTGRTWLVDGERVLDWASGSSSPGGADRIPEPLFMNAPNLGGRDFFWVQNGENCGQQGISGSKSINNVGLLVRLAGRVTYSDATCCYVDDGSRLDDGSGHLGVKVWGAGAPPIDAMVVVTGVSSCYPNGGLLQRQVYATDLIDLTSPPPQPTTSYAIVAGHFGRISLIKYDGSTWSEIDYKMVSDFPHGAAAHGANGYIVHNDGGYVSFVDAIAAGETVTLTEPFPVDLGWDPDVSDGGQWAAVSSAGDRLYVTSNNRWYGTLWIVDTSTWDATEIPLNWDDPVNGDSSLNPEGVIVAPMNPDQVYVAKRGYTGAPMGVGVFDPNGGPIRDVSVDGSPTNLAYMNTGQGSYVFVTQPDLNSITAIDVTSGQTTSYSLVSVTPDAIVAIGAHLYVVAKNSNNIYRFNFDPHYPPDLDGAVMISGGSPYHGLAVSSDGQFLLLTSPNDGKFYWIRVSDLTLGGSVDLPTPVGVAAIVPSSQ